MHNASGTKCVLKTIALDNLINIVRKLSLKFFLKPRETLLMCKRHHSQIGSRIQTDIGTLIFSETSNTAAEEIEVICSNKQVKDKVIRSDISRSFVILATENSNN